MRAYYKHYPTSRKSSTFDFVLVAFSNHNLTQCSALFAPDKSCILKVAASSYQSRTSFGDKLFTSLNKRGQHLSVIANDSKVGDAKYVGLGVFVYGDNIFGAGHPGLMLA